MDRIPLSASPPWWRPRLSPFWIRVIRPARRVRQRRREGLGDVHVHGLEHLRQAVGRGDGVLIASSHAGHVDAFAMLAAADRLGVPFQYMVAWQTFQLLGPAGRWILQRHGCFSINREGQDLRAFRQAVAILQHRPNPLVMFPEGEIYHHADRPAPFRTGTAIIALTAARAAARRIVCVPAAIRYRYLGDPTPLLAPVVDALERRLSWQPRPDLPLAQRLARFADGLLALRELEYVGAVQAGSFRDRTLALAEVILTRLEKAYQAPPQDMTIPERVTQLRRLALQRRDPSPAAERHFQDLCVAEQLFSYAEDYPPEPPSIEHLAELVDKYEEDVLGAPTATVRGVRQAVVTFGEPVAVPRTSNIRDEAHKLTGDLRQRVVRLLEGTAPAANRWPFAGAAAAPGARISAHPRP